MNTPEDVGPGRPRPRARGARVHVALDRRALAHPGVPHARPTRPAASCPLPYRRMMDPFLSLLLAAAGHHDAAGRHRRGPPPRARPVRAGQVVATLDRLSGGRFDFGVGVGWNVEELADHRPDIPWASALPGAGRVRRRAARRSGATTRRSTTAAGSTSTRCGRSRSRVQAPHPPIVGGHGRSARHRSTPSRGPTRGCRWTSRWATSPSGSTRFRAGGGRGRPPADARSS